MARDSEQQPASAPLLQTGGKQTTGITDRWYVWLLGAMILLAVGFGALVVLGDGETATGEEDTGIVNGVAYVTWLLSWLGAAATGVLGIVRGVRELARRRKAA